MGCCFQVSNIKKDQEEEFLELKEIKLKTAKDGDISELYTFVNPPLGSGVFGEVFKATNNSSGINCMIKKIQKDVIFNNKQGIIREIFMLENFDHPNIVKVFEFYENKDFYYVVTELCSGGELFDRIKKGAFSEEKAANTMKQILSAVHHLHANNVVHRDIKPENLIYETSEESSCLKLIDFGLSRHFNKDEKMSKQPYYIAPEVINKKYDEKCDVWSCGVILYILLCGYPPFNGDSEQDILNKGILKYHHLSSQKREIYNGG